MVQELDQSGHSSSRFNGTPTRNEWRTSNPVRKTMPVRSRSPNEHRQPLPGGCRLDFLMAMRIVARLLRGLKTARRSIRAVRMSVIYMKYPSTGDFLLPLPNPMLQGVDPFMSSNLDGTLETSAASRNQRPAEEVSQASFANRMAAMAVRRAENTNGGVHSTGSSELPLPSKPCAQNTKFPGMVERDTWPDRAQCSAEDMPAPLKVQKNRSHLSDHALLTEGPVRLLEQKSFASLRSGAGAPESVSRLPRHYARHGPVFLPEDETAQRISWSDVPKVFRSLLPKDSDAEDAPASPQERFRAPWATQRSGKQAVEQRTHEEQAPGQAALRQEALEVDILALLHSMSASAQSVLSVSNSHEASEEIRARDRLSTLDAKASAKHSITCETDTSACNKRQLKTATTKHSLRSQGYLHSDTGTRRVTLPGSNDHRHSMVSGQGLRSQPGASDDLTTNFKGRRHFRYNSASSFHHYDTASTISLDPQSSQELFQGSNLVPPEVRLDDWARSADTLISDGIMNEDFVISVTVQSEYADWKRKVEACTYPRRNSTPEDAPPARRDRFSNFCMNRAEKHLAYTSGIRQILSGKKMHALRPLKELMKDSKSSFRRRCRASQGAVQPFEGT